MLLEALRGNETLTTLELGYNPIGEEGAKHLADVLKYDLRVSLPTLSLKVVPHRHCAKGQPVSALHTQAPSQLCNLLSLSTATAQKEVYSL